MTAIDEGTFTWSEENYTIKQVVDNFSHELPFLGMATDGFSGRDVVYHTIGADEMYWMHSIGKQKRVVVKEHEKCFSIPYDYDVHVDGYVQHKVERDITLAEAIDNEFTEFCFVDDKQVEVFEGAGEGKSTRLGKVTIIEIYEEQYIVGHSLLEGTLAEAETVIPIYMPICIAMATGLVIGTPAQMDRMMNRFARLADSYIHVGGTPCNDIMVFDESQLEEGDYELFFPGPYNSERREKRNDVGQHEGDSDDADNVYDVGELAPPLPERRRGRWDRFFKPTPRKTAVPPKDSRVPPRAPIERSNTRRAMSDSVKALSDPLRRTLSLSDKPVARDDVFKAEEEEPSDPTSLYEEIMNLPPSPHVPQTTVTSENMGQQAFMSELSNAMKKSKSSPKPAPKPAPKPIKLDAVEVAVQKGFTKDQPKFSKQATAINDGKVVVPNYNGACKATAEAGKLTSPYSLARELPSLPQPHSGSGSAPAATASNSDASGSDFEDLHRVPRNLKQASVDQVCRCLRLLNMDKYVEAFSHEQMDGDLLCSMSEQILQDDFELSSLHAKKLMKFINGWRPNYGDSGSTW